MGAGSVLDALAAKKFKSPAHVMLREVRNRTGYGARERYADALVMSVFPSRGIWFAGVEVKVARGDWLRELADPEKSSDIQRFCHYWWLATRPGVVLAGELPAKWGHLEVAGTKVTVVRDAPLLDPALPTPEFVCSVLRNQGKAMASALADVAVRERKKAKEAFSGEAVAELERKLRDAEGKAYGAKHQLGRLEAAVADFEKAAGIQIDRWDPGGSAALLRAADRLRGLRLGLLADQLGAAALAVRAASETSAEPAVPELPA